MASSPLFPNTAEGVSAAAGALMVHPLLPNLGTVAGLGTGQTARRDHGQHSSTQSTGKSVPKGQKRINQVREEQKLPSPQDEVERFAELAGIERGRSIF